VGPSVFVSGFLWPPESSEGLAPPGKRSLFLDNFQSVKLRTASIAGRYRNAVATFVLHPGQLLNNPVSGLPIGGRRRRSASRSKVEARAAVPVDNRELAPAPRRSWNVGTGFVRTVRAGRTRRTPNAPIDPEQPFEVGPMNSRYAPECGRRRNATVAPEHEVAPLRPAARGREPRGRAGSR
jgi:hypothetical protein